MKTMGLLWPYTRVKTSTIGAHEIYNLGRRLYGFSKHADSLYSGTVKNKMMIKQDIDNLAGPLSQDTYSENMKLTILVIDRHYVHS